MLPVRHASAFHAAKVQLFSSTARVLVNFFQMRPSGRLLWFLGLEVGGWFLLPAGVLPQVATYGYGRLRLKDAGEGNMVEPRRGDRKSIVPFVRGFRWLSIILNSFILLSCIFLFLADALHDLGQNRPKHEERHYGDTPYYH